MREVLVKIVNRMYCAGKVITVIFSGVCVCFTKDLQSVSEF